MHFNDQKLSGIRNTAHWKKIVTLGITKNHFYWGIKFWQLSLLCHLKVNWFGNWMCWAEKNQVFHIFLQQDGTGNKKGVKRWNIWFPYIIFFVFGGLERNWLHEIISMPSICQFVFHDATSRFLTKSCDENLPVRLYGVNCFGHIKDVLFYCTK